MSATLGPIHTWLYNKILFQDELTKALIRNMPWENKVDSYCEPLQKGSLEQLIDESNIHGWLQSQIVIVEKRLAYAVTGMLKENPESLPQILLRAREFGKEHLLRDVLNAKGVYDQLEDLLLNGMPCDRVNEVVDSSDDYIRWIQTIQIHETYWQEVEGQVSHYDEIRSNLIQGMISETTFTFTQIDDQTFEIRKRAD